MEQGNNKLKELLFTPIADLALPEKAKTSFARYEVCLAGELIGRKNLHLLYMRKKYEDAVMDVLSEKGLSKNMKIPEDFINAVKDIKELLVKNKLNKLPSSEFPDKVKEEINKIKQKSFDSPTAILLPERFSPIPETRELRALLLVPLESEGRLSNIVEKGKELETRLSSHASKTIRKVFPYMRTIGDLTRVAYSEKELEQADYNVAKELEFFMEVTGLKQYKEANDKKELRKVFKEIYKLVKSEGKEEESECSPQILKKIQNLKNRFINAVPDKGSNLVLVSSNPAKKQTPGHEV